MSRLIDANALIKIYEGWIPQLMLPEDAGDKRGVETCIKVLQDAPTVDAVEVVRCRDCKHYDGKWLCKISGVPSRKPCDFCSHGESITEGENNGNNSN